MLNIQVFNTTLQLQAYIDDYKSFSWTKELNGVGDFTIKLPFNSDNMQYFKLNNIIVYGEFTGILTTLNAEYGNDGWTMVVKGQDILCLLNRRINTIASTATDGNVEVFMKQIVSTACMGTGYRKYNNLIFGTTKNYSDTLTYTPKIDTVLNVLADIGSQVNYKSTIDVNLNLSKYVFNVTKCADKTSTTNNPVVFSTEFNNVSDIEYVNSNKDYYNSVVAKGMEGMSYVLVINKTDIERIEGIADCTNVSNKKLVNGAEVTMSADEYNECLYEPAFDWLKSQRMNNYYNFTIDKSYAENLSVGDKITFIDKTLQLKSDLQIGSINKIYENNDIIVNIGFGEQNF